MTALLSRWATIALFSLFCAAAAQAQEQSPAAPLAGPLAGAQVMQLSVAPLGPDSQRCGLQTDVLADSFQRPLVANGIVMQKAAHFRVIVKATTGVYQADTCISNIEATVVQTTSYFDRKTQSDRAGQVLMWSQSRLFVSGQPDHAVAVNNGVSELARAFIRKWQTDQ